MQARKTIYTDKAGHFFMAATCPNRPTIPLKRLIRMAKNGQVLLAATNVGLFNPGTAVKMVIAKNLAPYKDKAGKNFTERELLMTMEKAANPNTQLNAWGRPVLSLV